MIHTVANAIFAFGRSSEAFMQNSEDEAEIRSGVVSLASLGKSMIRRHADLIRPNDPKLDITPLPQTRSAEQHLLSSFDYFTDSNKSVLIIGDQPDGKATQSPPPFLWSVPCYIQLSCREIPSYSLSYALFNRMRTGSRCSATAKLTDPCQARLRARLKGCRSLSRRKPNSPPHPQPPSPLRPPRLLEKWPAQAAALGAWPPSQGPPW